MFWKMAILEYPYRNFPENAVFFHKAQIFFRKNHKNSLEFSSHFRSGVSYVRHLSYPKTIPNFYHKTEIWVCCSSRRPRNWAWDSYNYFSKIKSWCFWRRMMKSYWIFLQNLRYFHKYSENRGMPGPVTVALRWGRKTRNPGGQGF